MAFIHNINDVKAFFRYLYEKRNVAFHPDDSFNSYINHDTGENTFSTEECKRFDRTMDECFSICEASDVDIYELASLCFNEVVPA